MQQKRASNGSSDERATKQAKVDDHQITKLSDIDHILFSADMYIGQSVRVASPAVSRFVYYPKAHCMTFRQDFCYPHGLLKIFDEILVNAADNVHRGTKTIKVGVNRNNNLIWVWNDGENFPILKTEHESRYNPLEKALQSELAFFHCKSSSAYTKTNRITGGKNGIGCKAASVFSKASSLEMCDGKMYYRQQSRDHMKQVLAPFCRPAHTKEAGKPFLSFGFQPDLSLFYPAGTAPEKFDDDMVNLFHTRVLDLAGTLPASTKIFWCLETEDDDATSMKSSSFERVKVRGFRDYVQLFLSEELKEAEQVKVAYHSEPRWEVCMIKNPYSFAVNVSFVNNINTYQGGQHLKYIQSQVFAFCKEKVSGISKHRVDSLVMLFVNATIEDPSFNSQTKEALCSPIQKFGSTCELPKTFLNGLVRNGVIDHLKTLMEKKQLIDIQKTIGSGKRKNVNDIEDLRDAEWAGTKKSSQCYLILVEGKSAKNLAEQAITVMGSECIGVKAMKGKGINVDVSMGKLLRNKELVDISRVMGLQVGKPATLDELRYGHIVVMTDQDVDGSHICGLLLFTIGKLWPTLLSDNYNFISKMLTPVIVAKNKKTRQTFYTEQSFNKWWQEMIDKKNWSIKYYKGLGTSSNKEGQEYFRNMKQNLRVFRPASKDDFQALDMVFAKKNAASRKTWLKDYDPSCYLQYEHLSEISIQDFLHKDFKHYSMLSIRRGIASALDGLTPAARKCLWTFLKRNITKDVKVNTAQSYADADTHYKQGADSLGQVIIRMAQTFTGSQNINLFMPSGQFGSRSDGGQNPASSRYIHTHLSPITRYLFPAEDDDILPEQIDDGHVVEPHHLMPILPMILVNGATAIATAYANEIPCFRPEDLLERVRGKLNQEEWRDIYPWYHKFKGVTKGDNKGNFTSQGIVTYSEEKKIYHITELPVGQWTVPYKKILAAKEEAGEIVSFKEDHPDDGVHFSVTVSEPVQDTEKFFRLSKKYSSNLTLLVDDPQRQIAIRVFDTVEDIFNYWFERRLFYYEKRRIHLRDRLQASIPYMQAKVTFVMAVISDKIRLGQPRQTMTTLMTSLGLLDEFHENLLRLSISSFTHEKVQAIKQELQDTQMQIEYYDKVNARELLLKDLKELEVQLAHFWLQREPKS